MKVKSLNLTRNTYAWEQEGTPPGEIGGTVVLEGAAGEIKVRLAPENVDAILATVAQAVALQVQILAGGVNPALVRNARSEALLLEALAEPITPAQEALVVEITERDPAVFARGQVWRTRNGNEATIQTVDDTTVAGYPLRAGFGGEFNHFGWYTSEGLYAGHGSTHNLDLVEYLRDVTLEAPIRPEGWQEIDTSVEEQAGSIAIAVGQVWRNRRGSEVEIASVATGDKLYTVEGHELDYLGGVRMYTAKGRYFADGEGDESDEDLVTFLRTKAAADAPVA